MIYDEEKLRRLQFDLEQAMSEQRGASVTYHEERDYINNLQLGFLGLEFLGMSRAELAGVTVDRELARDSRSRGMYEAKRVHDFDLAMRIATARERLAELQRRQNLAAAEVAPLAHLVGRCNAFVAGN